MIADIDTPSSAADRDGVGGQDAPDADARPPPAHPISQCCCVVLVLALSVHVALTILLASPPNPAQLALSDALTAYQRPHFQQNWQLFAPTPISDERILLVRARVRGEQADRVTGYVDITSPDLATSHALRFLAPKTPRVGLNLVQLLTWRDPIAQRLRDRVQLDDTSENPDLLLPSEEMVLQEADLLVHRYLCRAASDRWGTAVSDVQARLVVNEFPPYSRRTEPNSEGDVTIRDLPWMYDCRGA